MAAPTTYAAPQGDTTVEDSHDKESRPLIDERFRFAALGVEPRGERIACGLWFPGTEGEVTYSGDTYPGGQMHRWRRRYHPVQDGLDQNYTVAFRFARNESFPDFYSNAWRWAWDTLRPEVVKHNIEQARRSMVDLLGEVTAKTPDGRTGIPRHIDAYYETEPDRHPDAVIGFVGKMLEVAGFLLQDSLGDEDAERAEKHRETALAIVDSFTRIEVAPPASEGFVLATGEPALEGDVIHLRTFGDDVKASLRAILREKSHGHEHPEWLNWCVRYGDWLLTQQQSGGGFPRAWKPVTGEVADPAPQSSYNAIPFLLLLTDATGEAKYRDAALRAAEFCWTIGQADGRFIGGTIDNPNVIDKEAGTLSLEAYLMLFGKTGDKKWLDRATMAANFAETWIYIWNVPMPADEDNSRLHWKRGVPTAGLQLISSGHSLVDEYMAFDADEYAQMWKFTDDEHYLEVAKILLHNTKLMLALPGRAYDLTGPGWQQEHWSLAPKRGFGLHRHWLPWLATSQLNGIFGLEEFDADLYGRLSN